MLSGDQITDKIANTNFVKVKGAALVMLSGIQTKGPDVIISAGGVFFVLLCKQFDVSPRKVLEYVDRILVDAEEKYPEHLGGFKDFLREEL